jgi:hypothetical protein
VVVILRGMGVPVLVADTGSAPAGVVARQIAARAVAGLGPAVLLRTRSQQYPHPQQSPGLEPFRSAQLGGRL